MRLDLDLYRRLLIEFASGMSIEAMDFYDEETLMYYSKLMNRDGLLVGEINRMFAGNLRSSLRPTEKGEKLSALLKDERRWQVAKLNVQSRGWAGDSVSLLNALGAGDPNDDPRPIAGDEFEFRGEVHNIFRVDDVAAGPPRQFVVVESNNARWLIQAVANWHSGPRFKAVKRLQ